MIEHHTVPEPLTRMIGTLRSSIERVSSSFHSGLQLFFTARVFNFCINLYDVRKKEKRKNISSHYTLIQTAEENIKQPWKNQLFTGIIYSWTYWIHLWKFQIFISVAILTVSLSLSLIRVMFKAKLQNQKLYLGELELF